VGRGGAIAPRSGRKGNATLYRSGAADDNSKADPARRRFRGIGMQKTVTRQELETRVGEELGVSDWFLVDQARVNAFADVTLDHQFVHVDPEKARATPFGGTIAHGFLTLSLLVHLCLQFVPVLAKRKLLVNYGFDKIRFSAPVRVGKRIRAIAKLGSVEERKPKQVLLRVDVTVEVEGETKPALVAEWLSMHVVG
jgi:acyl dehydratase